jgi:hypothetical protein
MTLQALYKTLCNDEMRSYRLTYFNVILLERDRMCEEVSALNGGFYFAILFYR